MDRRVNREKVAFKRTWRPHFKLLDALGIRGTVDHLLTILWRAEIEQEARRYHEAAPQVTEYGPKHRPDRAIRRPCVILGSGAYGPWSGDEGSMWG